MKANKLWLNDPKTWIMVISKLAASCTQFSSKLRNQIIKNSNKMMVLGIIFNRNLNWEDH